VYFLKYLGLFKDIFQLQKLSSLSKSILSILYRSILHNFIAPNVRKVKNDEQGKFGKKHHDLSQHFTGWKATRAKVTI
jgi:hypothetical protein